MTGIGHLSTGLLLKGKFPRAPLSLLLLAAVAPDLVWAFLNLAPTPGRAPVEVTTVARPYMGIGSQQMVLQPWSHSLLTTALLAGLLAGLTFVAFRQRGVPMAVGLATLGHFVLDYFVHDADLTLWPAVEAVRVGPPFVMDVAHPGRGLYGAAPGLAFLLQACMMAWGTMAFARAFPSTRRHGRLVLWVGMAALALVSLPVFIEGALASVVTSTQGLVSGALAETALGAFVILHLVRWTGAPASPLVAAMSPRTSLTPDEMVRLVKNLLVTAGVLCFLLAAVYLGQGMRDAQRLPAVARDSTILAVVYAAVGLRFCAKNPLTLWAAILLGLVIGPLVRAAAPPGSFALGLFALEASLGLMSAALVRTLLRRDLLL